MASRFGKRYFGNLQLQMKTGALEPSVLPDIILKATCSWNSHLPFLSSEIITNIFSKIELSSANDLTGFYPE